MGNGCDPRALLSQIGREAVRAKNANMLLVRVRPSLPFEMLSSSIDIISTPCNDKDTSVCVL